MSEGALSSLVTWFVRKTGVQTLIVWALLSLLLSSLVFGLANAVRGLEAGLLVYAGWFGLLVGWLLARSRLTAYQAASLSVLIGVTALVIRVGQLSGQLAQLVRALNEVAVNCLRWRPALPAAQPAALPAPDFTPVLPILDKLWESTAPLLAHIQEWSAGIRTGSATYNPVATALVWSLAVWMAAAWAGWASRRRRQPLAAVTPAGALLVTILAYTGQPPTFLLLFLVATFLLVAWIHQSDREQGWQNRSVDYSEDVRLDIGIAVVILTMTLSLVASVSPVFSIRKLLDLANNLVQSQPGVAEPFGESLGIERPVSTNNPSPLTRLRSGGLPRDHLLGSGPELSEQVVMTVSTGDLPPGPSETVVNRPMPSYYWRSLTYDLYTGRGWSTGPTVTAAYSADQPTLTSKRSAQKVIRQTVRLAGEASGNGEGNLLYVAGELLWVDRAYRVDWRTRPDEETAVEGDIFGGTLAAKEYHAASLHAMPGAAVLRAAGREYPDWVRDRYLKLPETIPDRVLALARDLTATAPTPYDRAQAIETYLRSYPYNLDLPLPPTGRDAVDYFLFTLRQGYCDYYASAMVVLARAAGLPARLAMGYANGRYDAYTARYVVTEAEAHSWPEIYFPGYGWVAFEPTAGLPALDRTQADAITHPSETETGSAAPAPSWQVEWLRYLGWAGGSTVILVLAAIFWLLSEQFRLRLLPPVGAIRALYRWTYRQGRGLAVIVPAGSTPYEFASAFADRVKDLGGENSWGAYLFPAAQEVNQLADLYARATYSQHQPGVNERSHAIRIWRRLRWRLWLARIGGRKPRQTGPSISS